MSVIAETAERNRARIVTEVEAVVWHDNPDLHRLGRISVVGTIERLLDALVDRVRFADSPHLNRLLEDLLRQRKMPATVLLGSLVRLAGALRGALVQHVDSRRAVRIASAALDRAVAEGIEELRPLIGPPSDVPLLASADDVVEILPGAPSFEREGPTEPDHDVDELREAAEADEPDTEDAELAERRDPTMIRNIKEILASGGGEVVTATTVALALRGAPDDPEITARVQRDRQCGRALAIMRDAGARVIIDNATVVCGLLTARVGDTDAAEGLALALALQKAPDLHSCGFGVGRGALILDAEDAAVGDVIGRVISLATSAKDGVVLTDGAISDIAGDTFALRSVTATAPAFRLDPDQPQWLDRWEQSSLVVEPELTGQTESLKALRGQLRSPSRKVTMIRLRGRNGAGKHCLLQAGLAELDIPDDRVVQGGPHPLIPSPYWPVIAIVRRILGLDDGPVRDDALRSAINRLAHQSASTAQLKGLMPIVSALLGADEADETLIDVIEPEALRSEIAKTFRLLVEASADRFPDRPYVVVLREVENVDVPTLHALAHLARSYQGAAQLILALCYRGTFRPPTALADVGGDEIAVDPLDGDEVLAIARSMLDQDELPAEIVTILSDRAGRLPMMVTTMVRYLVEVGALYRREGVWERASPIKPADVPRRLTDLIARRIERLPPQLAGLLKSAATVGEPLAWRTLELVWVSRGVSHDEIRRSVGLLEAMGFLARAPDASLTFAHPLIRQVAYRMQSPEERRDTHALAVVAYRERYPDAIRQIPSVVFKHCLESEDHPGAREAAVHMVRRALLLHDFKRGLTAASEALSLPDTGSDDRINFDLLAARERIHDVRGNRDDQKVDIKTMVQIAESLKDDRRAGVALHRAARLNLLTGDLARARSLAGKALSRLRNTDPLDLSNALRTLALIRWHERDPGEAAQALGEALQIYERLGHRRGMGFVLHNLGLFALDTGAVEQARHYFERALALKEETEDQHGRAVVLDALGQVAFLEGNAERAAERYEEAVALREAAGDEDGVAHTQVNLGLASLARDPAQAESLARAALKRCRKRRQAATKVEANMLLAQALIEQGGRQAASRASSTAVKLAEQVGAQLLSIRAHLVRAQVDLTYRSKQRAERAADLAGKAAAAALKAGAVRWRIEALSLLAAARDRLKAKNAATPAREALALLEEKTAVGIDIETIRARCNAVLSLDEDTVA